MTNFPRRTALAAALCATGVALLTGQAAHADDDVKFKGGGFGTVGAVRTNTEGTQFRAEPTQWSGADKHVDLGTDSRLGLQGTVAYKSDFSLTAQLLGIRREDDDFGVDFEWLYAQYTGVPGLNLKAGRVALPGFLVSDSRRVGYATPWLRVPPLVYSMLSLSTVDGFQASYSHSIGPAVGSVQFTHGRGKSNLSLLAPVPFFGYVPAIAYVDQNNVNSLNALLEWGDWTVRVGQVKSEDSGTLDLNLPFVGLVHQPLDEFKDDFTGVGIQYDNGKAVAIAEYVKRKTTPVTSDSSAWYVGAGYRFGEVMPYVLVSKFTPKDGTKPTKGTAIGIRYDFAKNVDLKAEFARYDQRGFNFLDLTAPSAPDQKVNVISVALDFVF
jgi:hypothetical protein